MATKNIPLNVANLTPSYASPAPKPATMPAPAPTPKPVAAPAVAAPVFSSAGPSKQQSQANYVEKQQAAVAKQQQKAAAEAAEKARIAALPSYVDYYSGKTIKAPDTLSGSNFNYADWDRTRKASEYKTAVRDYTQRKALETYKAKMALPVLDDLGAYLQSIGHEVPTVFDPLHGAEWQRAMKGYISNMDPVLMALRNPNIVLPQELQTPVQLPEGITLEDVSNYMTGKVDKSAQSMIDKTQTMQNVGNYGSRAMSGGVAPTLDPRNAAFRILNYTDPSSGNAIPWYDPKTKELNFANPKLQQQYQQLRQEADDIYNAVTNPFSVFVYGAKPPKDYVAPKRHETIGPGGVKFGGEPGAKALGATNDNPIPKGVEGAGLWAIGIDPRDPRALYRAWDYATARMGPKDPFNDFAKYLYADKNGNYQKVLNPKIAGELLKRVDWHVRDTARKIDKSNAFMDTTIGKLVGAALTSWAGGINPWLGAVVGATVGSQTGGGSWLGALSGGISGGLGGVFSKFSPLTNVNSVLPYGYAARAGEFATKSLFEKAGDWVTSQVLSLPKNLYDKYLGPNSFITYSNMGQQAFFDSLQNDLRRSNIPVNVTVGANGTPALVPDTNNPAYKQYITQNAADAVTEARAGGLMSLRGAA
jgi:hypothetical protein